MNNTTRSKEGFFYVQLLNEFCKIYNAFSFKIIVTFRNSRQLLCLSVSSVKCKHLERTKWLNAKIKSWTQEAKDMRALVVFGGESRPSEIRILNRAFAEWFFKQTKCLKTQWSNLFEKIAKFQKIHKKSKITEKPKKFTKFQKNQKEDNSTFQILVFCTSFSGSQMRRGPWSFSPLKIWGLQIFSSPNNFAFNSNQHHATMRSMTLH